MDGGAWWAAVHGIAKSRTRPSNFTLTFHFHALEKEMATHSSVFAWRIPEMGKPGALPSMGSHRVGHNWSDLAAAAAAADIRYKYSFWEALMFLNGLSNFTWDMTSLNKTWNASYICRKINLYMHAYIHIHVAIHKEYNLPVWLPTLRISNCP